MFKHTKSQSVNLNNDKDLLQNPIKIFLSS